MCEILECDHSNESYWAVLSCGAIYHAVQGDSYYWVLCGWKPRPKIWLPSKCPLLFFIVPYFTPDILFLLPQVLGLSLRAVLSSSSSKDGNRFGVFRMWIQQDYRSCNRLNKSRTVKLESQCSLFRTGPHSRDRVLIFPEDVSGPISIGYSAGRASTLQQLRIKLWRKDRVPWVENMTPNRKSMLALQNCFLIWWNELSKGLSFFNEIVFLKIEIQLLSVFLHH